VAARRAARDTARRPGFPAPDVLVQVVDATTLEKDFELSWNSASSAGRWSSP